jgi:hypothetical protein
MSRGRVFQQDSDCGGAVVVGIEAVYVYAMPEYVGHAVVEVHNARNVSRLGVCQAAEEGAKASIGDRRPSVVAASAHPLFGAPSDELLLIFCGATRKQGVDNSVAHSMTKQHEMRVAKVRVVDGGAVLWCSNRAGVDVVKIVVREPPAP